ncbi:Clp protease ClpP [Marinobacter bryozoorum]|uniref:head maturation protease, ClpP-related n=1 Tax=Marinobacter bryozoorum TaxID=256324 RepID=UPI002004FB29|nr:head maturation protease, ClpP-related [Marinobacter bryozoorum]MCK7542955.1 Clp protease ClpP [Marinobacter bryozoorum]
MAKKWFDVRAQADRKEVSVSIRGFIGEWGVSDSELIREVEAAGDVEMINVNINSRGGEVDHGLSIYNFLRTHPALVSVRIDGIAASAASVIAMAGDEITMPANALMMVHNPWTFAMGNAAELRKTADDLEQFEKTLLATYTARTGKDEEAIKDLLDDETWLTAAEAVELGFADTVESLAQPAAVAMAKAMDIPAEILAKVAEIEKPAAPTEPAEPQQPESNAEASEENPEAKTAEIVALCVERGFAAKAADWLREGITLDDAKQRILDAQAADDEARNADPVILPGQEDGQAEKEARSSWAKAFKKTQPRGKW